MLLPSEDNLGTRTIHCELKLSLPVDVNVLHTIQNTMRTKEKQCSQVSSC